MVSTVDPTSVGIPFLHCLVMIPCCVLIICLLSAYPQDEELWMYVCGVPAEGTATLFCESNPLFCGSNPFCYSYHELVHMRLTGVAVLDWNLPRVGVCAPVCCAVGPLEMLDGQSVLPMMCEHHRSWFDKLLVRRWASVFSGFVGTDFAPDTGSIPDPVIIRGVGLFMNTYMLVGGTGFQEQLAAQAQSYTVALYQDGLATGYLRYPFRVVPGSGLVATNVAP